MQCPKCHNKATAESKFCNICGQRLPMAVVGSTSAQHTDSESVPQWYRSALNKQDQPNLDPTISGVRRIQFGIAGRQPRKWLAELGPGDRVRIAFAEGAIQHRKLRPWEKHGQLPLRRPWTTKKEGALLLLIENQAYRYADIRHEWVTNQDRSQVYVGIEDKRHQDNQGEYQGIIEISDAPINVK